MAAGSRYCSECGTPVRADAGSHARSSTNVRARIAVAVAAVVLATVIAVVAVSIGRRSPPNAGQGNTSPLQLAGSPPDISSLSPQERAARLYDRVMRLHEERKTDSIEFFAPMALGAYASIPDKDLHTRYDMARVAMVVGALPVARAQSDTIARSDSTYLLGLLLSADLARANNNEAAAKRLETTFIAVASRERQRNLPEYAAHEAEIDAAMKRLQGNAKR